MGKLNLKSLENTVVHTPTKAEYDELMIIYQDAGWRWYSGMFPKHVEYQQRYDCVEAFNSCTRNCRSYFEHKPEYKIITLDQFKKLQKTESEPQIEDIDKIMLDYGVLKPRYNVGDVLISYIEDEYLVLSVSGYVITLSDCGEFTKITTTHAYTQNELDDKGFKLYTETPEPTKTKFTMQEIADKIGMGVDDFVVRYEFGGFIFEPIDPSMEKEPITLPVTIIGNITDNPELLEGK